MYTWNDVARVIATIPFIPGHECAGTVVKCGPKANIQIGTKVGVENHYFCGDCYQCKHDCKEICKNMGQFGLVFLTYFTIYGVIITGLYQVTGRDND
jgi:threonine 3-dehydrogenase